MSVQAVIDVIKTKLKEGVGETELSSYLIDAGYSLYDVDRLLNEAKKQMQGNKSPRISDIIKKQFNQNKKYLIAAVIGLIGLLLLFWIVSNFILTSGSKADVFVVSQFSNVSLGDLNSE